MIIKKMTTNIFLFFFFFFLLLLLLFGFFFFSLSLLVVVCLFVLIILAKANNVGKTRQCYACTHQRFFLQLFILSVKASFSLLLTFNSINDLFDNYCLLLLLHLVIGYFLFNLIYFKLLTIKYVL